MKASSRKASGDSYLPELTLNNRLSTHSMKSHDYADMHSLDLSRCQS